MKLHFASAVLLIVVMLPIASLACSHTETAEPGFGIYLVETGELILSEQHIESYNASSYEIELNGKGIEQWNSFVASHDPEGTAASSIWCLHQKDFSVKVGEEEIYTGKFWSPVSSLMCEDIVIMYFPELSDEYNTLWINYGYSFPPDDNDPRNDPRIIDFFESEGLLSATEETETTFGIYLAETGELMISDEHIESYNMYTHKIVLNEKGLIQWNSFFTDVLSLNGEHFVVEVNGEEIYSGVFQSIASSYAYIGEVTISYIPGYDRITIDYGCLDPRNNPRIIDFFTGEGLLE